MHPADAAAEPAAGQALARAREDDRGRGRGRSLAAACAQVRPRTGCEAGHPPGASSWSGPPRPIPRGSTRPCRGRRPGTGRGAGAVVRRQGDPDAARAAAPRAERLASQVRPEAGRAAIRRARSAPASGWPRPARSTSSTPSPRTARGHHRARAPACRAPGPRHKWLTASVAGDAAQVDRGGVRRGRTAATPSRERTWIALADGNKDQIRQIRRPGRRPRHHRPGHHRPHPRHRAPVGRRLVLSPRGQPRRRHLGPGPHRRPPGRPRPGRRRRRRRQAAASRRPRPWARPAAPSRPDRRLPRSQGPPPGLPRRAGRRLAHRHRRHRGRLPPPDQRPHGHHRRPLGHSAPPKPSSSSAPCTANGDFDDYWAPAPGPRTRTQPPSATPSPPDPPRKGNAPMEHGCVSFAGSFRRRGRCWLGGCVRARVGGARPSRRRSRRWRSGRGAGGWLRRSGRRSGRR